MIHPLSDCKAYIPQSTNIWQFCVIFPKAKIGKNCNVCANVLIEDNVFIGPNATFTNDLFPRSKNQNWELKKTIIKNGASIGANATILCGITIGENAMIGAGSVVTKDVPVGEVWVGNPAKFLKKIEG